MFLFMIFVSDYSIYVMLMIDRQIEASMRIDCVGFEFLGRNGSKPLKFGISVI